MTYRIAYFITPHGFGHAGRASAVMESLHRLDSGIIFDIYTTIPEWFFRQSIKGPYNYHSMITDVGLVQLSSVTEDLKSTLDRLSEFEKMLTPKNIQLLATKLNRDKVNLIVADISPLGILAGKAGSIPVCLIENFTWDWIYDSYVQPWPVIRHYISLYQTINDAATYRIQSEPLCSPRLKEAFYCPPIARSIRTDKLTTLNQLDLPTDHPAIMITMGGIPQDYQFMEKLYEYEPYSFILPGVDGCTRRVNNVAYLPHHSEFFHPDLINASDLIIGKAGYSTIAEVYQAGNAFGYILRPDFRESGPLDDFIKKNIPSREIPLMDFESGEWLKEIGDSLSLGTAQRIGQKGALMAAEYLITLLEK